MSEIDNPNNARRLQGRLSACEGLLASQFGQRTTLAGAKALERLRAMQSSPSPLDQSRQLTVNADDRVITLPGIENRYAHSPSPARPLPGFFGLAQYTSWLALAAMVILLLGGFGWLVFMLTQSSSIASLQSADAGMTLLRGARSVALTSGTTIKTGDKLQSRSRASMSLQIGARVVKMSLQPSTEIVFGSTSHPAAAQLNRGSVEVEVGAQGQGEIIFVTSQADVLVTGTHFNLAARSTSTWLDVFEGKVELIRKTDGRQILVEAHYRAVAAPGLDMTAHPSEERWQTPYAAAIPSDQI